MIPARHTSVLYIVVFILVTVVFFARQSSLGRTSLACQLTHYSRYQLLSLRHADRCSMDRLGAIASHGLLRYRGTRAGFRYRRYRERRRLHNIACCTRTDRDAVPAVITNIHNRTRALVVNLFTWPCYC